MMKLLRSHRVALFAGLLGVSAAAVTFLGAARVGGDAGKPPGDAPKAGVAGDPSGALICLGTVDRQTRAYGMFPHNFPQPSDVAEVLAHEGLKVRQGDDLLKLNVVPDKKLGELTVQEAEAAVAEAEALLAQANQALEIHSFAIESQQAVVEAKQYALASKQHDIKDLRNAVEKQQSTGRTKNELAAAEDGLKALQKEVDAETRKLEGLKRARPTFKVDQARAGLRRARVNQQKAQHALEPLMLKAPTDGTVLRINCAVGASFGPQTREPALLFQPASDLIVRAEIEQEFANQDLVGRYAEITDYNSSKGSWEGKVLRVADAFLPKRTYGTGGLEALTGNDTGVLECIVSIQNTRDLPKIGQRVRVALGKKD